MHNKYTDEEPLLELGRETTCACGHDHAHDHDEEEYVFEGEYEFLTESGEPLLELGRETTCACGIDHTNGHVHYHDHHHDHDHDHDHEHHHGGDEHSDIWEDVGVETEQVMLTFGDGNYALAEFDVEDDTCLYSPELSEYNFVHNGITLHVRQWGSDPVAETATGTAAGEATGTANAAETAGAASEATAAAPAARVTNTSARPLVLLHGFMQSGASWNFLGDELGHERCVYAVDLPGHGQTVVEGGAENYSLAAAADAVEAFIREIVCPTPADQRQRRAHLLGYSMGGRVALEVALRPNPPIFSLILESAGLGPYDEEDRNELAARNTEWARELREGGVEAFVDKWEGLPLFETQAARGLDKLQRAQRLANNAEKLALSLEQAGRHTMDTFDDIMMSLSNVFVPIKYIRGSEDESTAEVAHMMDNYGFDVSVVEAGHNVHLETPLMYARVLREFFDTNELKGL